MAIQPPPTWLREIVIAGLVGFGVSTYYSHKTEPCGTRSEQTERPSEQVRAASVAQERNTPANLACPDGTALTGIVSFTDWEKDRSGRTKDWECIGKPKQVVFRTTAKTLSQQPCLGVGEPNPEYSGSFAKFGGVLACNPKNIPVKCYKKDGAPVPDLFAKYGGVVLQCAPGEIAVPVPQTGTRK